MARRLYESSGLRGLYRSDASADATSARLLKPRSLSSKAGETALNRASADNRPLRVVSTVWSALPASDAADEPTLR
jgi:hypothetical protein